MDKQAEARIREIIVQIEDERDAIRVRAENDPHPTP